MRRASISVSPQAAERARRESLAARLSGRPSSGQIRAVSGKTPSSQPAATGASPEQAKAAADALRRRYEEKVVGARGRHVSALTQAAVEAASRGDLDGAAAHYREALAHSSDPALKIAYEDVIARARQHAVDSALTSARDYESQKAWREAAAAYARAFALSPDAEVAYRAASAYRRAGSDPRRAARLAEEAVKLDPHKANYRLTLALIYVDAGLMLRARGELDRAQTLEPTNPLIRDVMAKLRLR
jgi:tetratricopeptide (TPR) repeat protein